MRKIPEGRAEMTRVDATLQITLSGGDIDYAELTVPMIVEAHRNTVKEIIAIVDICRPQKTFRCDPDEVRPEPAFSQRASAIRNIAERFRKDKYFDRIFYLEKDSVFLSKLRKKYLNNYYNGTHDFRGFGMMSYYAAIELADTRYVAHYDADMMIYQKDGYDWIAECIDKMKRHNKAVTAVPRVAPPFSTEVYPNIDLPSLHEGRRTTRIEGGWRNDWFNSQCFLVDKHKLEQYLPLISGRTYIQHLIFKYIMRTTPKSPEMLMIRHLGGRGLFKFISDSEDAWILHPQYKPSEYIEMLPNIILNVKKGQVPVEQKGYGNIEMTAWKDLFASGVDKD